MSRANCSCSASNYERHEADCEARIAARAKRKQVCGIMKPQEMVREFHEAFGLMIRETPTLPDADERELRATLIREEYAEAWDELESGGPITAVAQELADLIYVVYGTALHYGIDLDTAVAEVHRANMSKLDGDGKPLYREDGKVLKGPNYRAPDMLGALDL